MFKNKVILGIAILALAFGPAVVGAQTTTATSTGRPFKDIREEYRNKVEEVREGWKVEKKEIRGEVKEIRVEAREDLKNATNSEDRIQIREERRDDVKNLREQKIVAFGKKITARLNVALDRSARFIERIESILKNREDNGQPVGNADAVKAKLTEAKNMIPGAQSLADALSGKIEVIVNNASSTTKYTDIRNLVTEATQAVKNVHAKVVEAVRSITN